MKILFFTPTAGQSGSEQLLLRMIEGLDLNEIECGIYIENGNQNPDIKGVKTFCNPFNTKKGLSKLLLKCKNFLFGDSFEKEILKIHKKFKPDFWYLNTVLMAPMASIASKHNIKFVSHLHERPHIIFELVKAKHLENFLLKSELSIGNAQNTCKILEQLGSKNIAKIYPFLENNLLNPNPQTSNKLRKALKIDSETYIWVISGALTFAKGVDFLPKLALQFPYIAFVWIGGNTDSGSYYFTQKICENLKNVYLVGPQNKEYLDYFGIGNGLLVLSLEESFGLVMLEALRFNMPIITFETGAVHEILTPKIGKIIPNWDYNSLCLAIEEVSSQGFTFDRDEAKRQLNKFDKAIEIGNWKKLLKNVNEN